MATIKWIDGFDYYTTVLAKYDEGWGSYYNGSWYTSLPEIGDWGRCGTPGLKFSCTEGGIRKSNILGNATELTVGMAVKIGQATRHYLYVLEHVSTPVFYVFIGPEGRLYACTGAPGETEVIVASSPFPVTTMGIWHHFETKVTIGASAIFQFSLDGDTGNLVIDAAGLDISAESSVDTIVFGSEKWVAAYAGQGTTRYVDDISVQAGSSLALLGDARVLTKMPTGAGSSTQFTPSAGNNWECVDEKPPNETDYVYSNNVGDLDLYDHTDLPANTDTVLAIAVNHYSTKLDAGIRKVGAALKIGGNTNIGASVVPSLGSYRHFQEVYDGPYSLSDCNACEFGVKITE